MSKFQVNTTPNNRVIEPQIPVENTSNFNDILKRIESNFFNQSINRDLHKLNNKSTLLLFIHQLKKGKDRVQSVFEISLILLTNTCLEHYCISILTEI